MKLKVFRIVATFFALGLVLLGTCWAQQVGNSYSVENQWGGASAPWHPAGIWNLGAREGQRVVALDIQSDDLGKTFTGTMTYQGEGPIGFRAKQIQGNSYSVKNQWGGASAAWHPGGTWTLGGRDDQRMVKLNFSSSDSGDTLSGTLTYQGEGPIGFRAYFAP
jgi:hypothetical protein